MSVRRLILLFLMVCSPLWAQQQSHTVLVRPFQVSGPGAAGWFGGSIARSLEDEARTLGLMPAKDPELLYVPRDPLQPLISRGIGLLIEGECESDGHTLRIRGRVIDLAQRSVRFALAAEGASHELLTVKDVLVGQFRQGMAGPAPVAVAPIAASSASSSPPSPGASEAAGYEFAGSRLADSLRDPTGHDRHYVPLLQERLSSRRWRYPLATYGYGYPYVYAPIYYPQPVIVQQQQQSSGISFDASYRSSKWKIDISGGASQSSGSGVTGWGNP